MALKECEKCGESAEEAKAFCPACGWPFVSEDKRQDSSEFDKYAGTVNVSQSVYKMMLADFDVPTAPKPKPEIAPVPQPVVEPVVTTATPTASEKPKLSNWLQIAIIGIISFWIIILASVLAVLFYFYF